MKNGQTAEDRKGALDVYLAQRSAQGFRVETRSATQAVILRRHPLHFLMRWFARGRAEQRLVVSVDAHGEVTALAAEPVRW